MFQFVLSLVLSFLFTSYVSSFAPLDSDLYLLGELSRVVKSKYESQLDKTLTVELQNELDSLLETAPFFRDTENRSSRTRRSSEVKEGKFLYPISRLLCHLKPNKLAIT